MSGLRVSMLQSSSWWFQIYSVLKWCSCLWLFLDKSFSHPESYGSDPETHVAAVWVPSDTQTQLSPCVLFAFYCSVPTCHPPFLFFKLHLTTFPSAGYCTASLLVGSFLMSASQWSEYWIHLADVPSQTEYCAGLFSGGVRGSSLSLSLTPPVPVVLVFLLSHSQD